MDRIVIDMVGRRLGQTWAVRETSFDIVRGEVFGVFGRSGAGKTTLLKLIAGLDNPTSGSLYMESSGPGEASWLDARAAMALQRPGLAPDLTVHENLRLTSSLWGIARKGRTSRTAMFIELLGLAACRNKRVWELSEGQKAAAEIARALAAKADITLIDGLIDRLDRPTRRRLWEFIKVASRRGSTFIVGTASSAEAEMCDRLAALARGRLVFVGTPEELKAAAQIDVVVVESIRNPLMKSKLKGRFGASVTEKNGTVEFNSRNGQSDAARILSELESDVGAVYVRQPTLDDALDRVEAG